MTEVSAARGERIAIFSHSHPSMSRGGAEIAAYTLFEGLQALGRDPLFIAACPEQDRDRLALASSSERALFYPTGLYDHFYQRGSPALTRQLEAILEEERVGLINFHHFMNVGIGTIHAMAARPDLVTVATLHEFLPICHHHGQMVTRPAKLLCSRASTEACLTCFPEFSAQKFRQRRDGFLDAFADVAGFISPSLFLADRFVEWGLPANRVVVIENGLQRLVEGAGATRTTADRPWVFGFFGQINPFKGVDVLLEAAELLAAQPELAARVRLRIHGNLVGQPHAFVERFLGLVEQLPFLTYAGPYGHDTVHQLMDQCDYVVVPSQWWENSPIVIQEAYAAGRPVICSGIGGMAEKVRDQASGLHFRVGDAADLVSVLERAADSSAWERLRSGIPPVYGAVGMAERYLDAFEAFRTLRAAAAPAPEAPGRKAQTPRRRPPTPTAVARGGVRPRA